MRRTDGFLKKNNLALRCPVCGRVAEYTPIEYMGETVVCKHCGAAMTWPQIFPGLARAEQRRVLQIPYLRTFLKGSPGGEPET